MGASSDTYHEPVSELTAETRDLHRAFVSVIEEIEAIDWYYQRAEVCDDEGLASILRHNMEEEMEHAMMGLEWIRRRLPKFDHFARSILFRDGPITGFDEEHAGASSGAASSSSLGIGLLAEQR
jgi:hypothetical protein